MEVIENFLVGNSTDKTNNSTLNFYSSKDFQDYFTNFKILGWSGAETDISPFGNFDFDISIIVNTAFRDELKIKSWYFPSTGNRWAGDWELEFGNENNFPLIKIKAKSLEELNVVLAKAGVECYVNEYGERMFRKLEENGKTNQDKEGKENESEYSKTMNDLIYK